MSETDLQLGGGYTYQWECAILLALNYFHEPVSYSSTLYDLITGFLGQVDEIHLEGEDREKEVELEDINLYGGGRRILVQVKTMQAEESHWTPGKDPLLKSLYRFYTSRYLVEEPDDTRFVFLTNRPFNSTLVLLNKAIRADELAESPEAQELFERLKSYAHRKKKDTPNLDQFRQMLGRTALVKYLDLGTVKANVQAKLQAYGRTDWKRAYESLFAHFAYQSTRAGGGTVTPTSLEEVLGPRTLEEPVLRGLLARTDRRVLVGLAVLAVLIVAASAALYLQQRPKPPPPMSGTYNVAVAGFAEQGHSGTSETGMELARSIHSPLEQALGELEQKLKEIDPAYTVEIRGPDDMDTVKGNTPKEREAWAAGIAQDINADVVVYAVIEPEGNDWQATLEFYIRPESFDEAEEIVGAHGLGQPFPFAPGGEPAERLKASSTGGVRVQALTRVVVGLSHYALGEYAEALEILKPAISLAGWQPDQGKEVIYLLTGNAACKLAGSALGEAGHVEGAARSDTIAMAEELLAQAEADYRLARNCDAEYVRAYIGLGDVLYLRALLPFARSLDYAGVDTRLLDEAIDTYQKAQGARHQPAGTNVAAKVYFGLGQCYLMKALAGELDASYGPAIDAFEAVIAAYRDGAEPLLRERAAESHARLGLIARLQEDIEAAISHYDQAISLTKITDRKASWLQRMEELKSIQDDST